MDVNGVMVALEESICTMDTYPTPKAVAGSVVERSSQSLSHAKRYQQRSVDYPNRFTIPPCSTLATPRTRMHFGENLRVLFPFQAMWAKTSSTSRATSKDLPAAYAGPGTSCRAESQMSQ
jgi:hypothetical protein